MGPGRSARAAGAPGGRARVLLLLTLLLLLLGIPTGAVLGEDEAPVALPVAFLRGTAAEQTRAAAEIRRRGRVYVGLLRTARKGAGAADPALRERITRLLALIETDWQRAQTPEGMVYIPAGALEVPREKAPWGPSGARTQVAAFYIDKTEVTVAAWRAYRAWRAAQEGGAQAAARLWDPPADMPGTLPVVRVRCTEARAYAADFRRGRLPTAAEFERALRGSGVSPWPWGSAAPTDRANLRDLGPGDLQPVGSYPSGASSFGVLDLVGNVSEWSSSEVAQGRVGRYPLVLGGSYRDRASPALTWRGRDRMQARIGPTERRPDVGFRVARSAPALP